jgi:nitronate monooxygenase
VLHTFLTDDWDLRYPIISAPMAGVAGGRLARAVSEAGGLGMIGVGSQTTTDFIRHEADIAGEGGTRFGIGLMAWAIEERPELLATAIEVKPYLVSISFGPVAAYVDPLHHAGIRVATQVQDRTGALEAEAAGVDLVVAQGTEAGGHTGKVSTLPLLQIVLESVDTPVVAAGGIGSARGLSAVLAAGAEGGWIGTAFLVSEEAAHTPEARKWILAAGETETILTHAFDRAQGLAWPERYPGRALQNAFTERWHDRERELADHPDVMEQLARAREERNYDLAYIYAGEAIGLVGQERPAGAVVHDLGSGAEVLLRRQYETLLKGPPAAT